MRAGMWRMLGASALVTVAGTGGTLPAVAQTTGVGGLEDIVVTARRQSESMQKIPVAITALSADDLASMNIGATDRISRVTPNLNFSKQPSNLATASVMIRGVGQSQPSMNLDMAVGVYLDGVYVARTAGSLLDIIDAERVEVLRGPQGTLFGRNTTGGALQIISQAPSDDLGLVVRAGYGSRNSWMAKGRFDTGKMGGSPLSAAFTFQHQQKDGYFDNLNTPAGQDPGSLVANSFRAQLRGDWGPFQLSYSWDYDKRKGAPAHFQIVGMDPDVLKYFSNSVNLGGDPIQTSPREERLHSGLLGPSPVAYRGHNPYLARNKSWGHNLTLSYELSDHVMVKSITGYRGLEIYNAYGLSGGGNMLGVLLDPVTFAPSIGRVVPYDGFAGPRYQQQFSQELQLIGQVGDLSYTAGLYYFWERFGEENHQILAFVLPGGDAAMNVYPVLDYSGHAKSYAAYAQLSWKPAALDEKLELTGGVRYTKDKKDIALKSAPGSPEGDVSFSNTSFLGSLSYQFTDTFMAYAKVATGYNSGGFNPQATYLNSFGPQKLVSAEAGLKAELFDRHVRANLAVFWSRYKDLQMSQFVAGSGGATSEIVNAGKATFKGVEGELSVIPFEGLTLSGSFGLTDMKYNEFLYRDPVTDVVENIAYRARFAASAKFNSNVGVQYVFPKMDIGQFSARFDWSHRSGMFFFPDDHISRFNRDIASPRQDTLSARVALSDIPLGGRALGEVALTGENLTNQDQVTYAVDFGSLGFAGVTYNEPRRFGVEFKVRY